MRPELAQAIELLHGNTPEETEKAIGLLQQTVYSFSMKVCGHPEDAEDTMQEVLYRSLGHLAKLEDPRALAVWLYTVTRNRCWRMRSKGSAVSKKTLSLEELMPGEVEMARLLEDASKEPENSLLRGEQHKLLHQAILRIPAQLRIVLVLHDMEELDTGEVAQILALQAGTVRVRLHRARLSVRKELSKIVDASTRAKHAKSTQARPRRARRKTQRRPTNATSFSPIFPTTLTVSWSRSPARRCASILRRAPRVLPSCATCVPQSTAAVRCRSLATAPWRRNCRPS